MTIVFSMFVTVTVTGRHGALEIASRKGDWYQEELEHPAGTSINFAFWEEIRKFCLAFTIVVYEKIFESINN